MEIAGDSLEVQGPPRVASRAPGIAVSGEELLRRHEAGGGRLAASNARSAAAVPALRTVVVTCMDTRIDVQALFGLGLGEVHTLRNAGGVVTDDVVRSVVVSQRKLGTREVLVVAHSRCGMATFSDDDFSEELAAEVGMRPLWRTYAFADPAVDVQPGRGTPATRSLPAAGDGRARFRARHRELRPHRCRWRRARRPGRRQGLGLT